MGMMITSRRVVVFLCLLAFAIGARRKSQRPCPRGWQHYCEDQTKCVTPMTEFDSGRQCLRKGGVPGSITCLESDIESIHEQHARMCIIDMVNGEVGFARNLKAAIRKLEDEEAKEREAEEAEMEELDKAFAEEDA